MFGPVAPVRHGLRHDAISVFEQRFVAHEFVAVLLEDRRGERLATHHENGLAVFLQLVHQRNKIAVAADDGERVHVRMGEGHLQRVESEIDVGTVLVAERRRQTLHHLDGVFGHRSGGAFLTSPVCISEFCDQVATFFERIQRKRYVEFPPKRGFHTDLDVVVIDEYGDVQFFLHWFFLCFSYKAVQAVCFTEDRMKPTISSSEAPGWNTAATPSCFNLAASSSGIIPPMMTRTSSCASRVTIPSRAEQSHCAHPRGSTIR